MGDSFADKRTPVYADRPSVEQPQALRAWSPAVFLQGFLSSCAVVNAAPGPAINSSLVGSACEIRLEAKALPTCAALGEMGRVELTVTCSVGGQNFVTKALRQN